MPDYLIHNTTPKDAWRAPHTHILEADVTRTRDGERMTLSVDELLRLQENQATFAVVANAPDREHFPIVHLTYCDCRAGYRLKEGPPPTEDTSEGG